MNEISPAVDAAITAELANKPADILVEQPKTGEGEAAPQEAPQQENHVM